MRVIMNLNKKLNIKYRYLLSFLAISLIFVTPSSAESASEEKVCKTLKCLSPVLKVYFSRSKPDIRAPLIEVINKAKKSIDAYFYQCNDKKVRKALVNAKKKGIKIRFITDAHYYEKKEDYYDPFYGHLEKAGIELITEVDGGKNDDNLHSHNKFAIIDEEILWTGSYNITENGRDNNNNNAVLIKNESLAKTYLEEFNQIWGDETGIPKFGNEKEKLVSFSKKKIGNISNLQIEAIFSPFKHSKKLKEALMSAIDSADFSIYFAAFVFTDKELMNAIIDKAKEGIKVYGVFDNFAANAQSGTYQTFSSSGVENIKVYIHNERDGYAKTLHHKFIIVDPDTEIKSDPLVVTGSSNWTQAAWKENDENTIIIHNNAIAKAFQREFKRLVPKGAVIN